MTGDWITGSGAGGDAPVLLFCVPHAGGGGGFFRPWAEALRPDVRVLPVVLPGRERRLRERPLTRAEDIVGPLARAVARRVDRPFAVLGHSMGSVLAYEVARRLESEGHHPLCLFASGRRAPHLPARRPPLHPLPEAEFLDQVGRLNGTPPEVLRDAGLRALFTPSLRADFEVNETYAPLPGPPLRCRVSALVGGADPEADLEEVAAWRHATTGEFTLRVFHGDHFYLKGAPAELLAAIRADLRRGVEAVAGPLLNREQRSPDPHG
ncbi:thioesterase II family protein [Saccharothrix coeruleofusca]|uniref:Thioesterase n=1 Tax=Saccharothrix coeruleofusca TaxID=33919 RepID=A0A918ECT5_9PSEU|nr:alpha/beta fold hydrolase [Saccharothrix coeruleofusca]MBP2336633.1 surfactin synthase thioesterase subunit [Saccharothrix coeruleofusca]GGP51590.1 thioesterase [Saccharothrix coeruleofusca]GGP84922.1 thioesterase [Saccharothrix coeruleofusca]